MINRSLTIVAVISIIAIAFSGVNSYLLFVDLQSDQELQKTIGEVNNRINPIESEQSALSNQISENFENLISQISKLDKSIQNLEKNVSSINEKTEYLLTQSPINIYEAVHKSVVVVRTDLGQGSGFLIESLSPSIGNYILTNWHVVGSTSNVEVEFYDRTRSKAVIIGIDAYSDIAVIMAGKTPIDSKPLQLANSTNLIIGQEIIAIGNPLGLEGSLSSGLISQLNAQIDYDDVPIIVPVIQIDLSIAPGSSGGPLLDLYGNVIGITNAGSIYGFNFAIPSNIVNRVATSIIDKGYYSHALIGFNSLILTPEIIKEYSISNIEPSQTGMLVTYLMEGLPAEEAGLIPVVNVFDAFGNFDYIIAKDIILAIDNHTIIELIDWQIYVSEKVSPGQHIILTVLRSGEIINIEITPTFREQYQE